MSIDVPTCFTFLNVFKIFVSNLIFKRRDQGSKVKEATTWFILLIEYRLLLLLCDVLTLVTVGVMENTKFCFKCFGGNVLGPQASSWARRLLVIFIGSMD